MVTGTLGPGSRVGPYEVISLLGKGGMGEVWRSRDTRLDRDVALKALPDEVAGNADSLARLTREAKLLAQLSHPGIAAIHAVEEFDGRRFLSMELAEGEDLSELIRRGPVPLLEALSIARQIAEALEEAHEKGIVHRDLKPSNVKVSGEGRVKLLDFGLAKAWAGEPGPVPDATNSPTLSVRGTVAGMILGTAAYMSPEQARGKPVDRRADIWAFGVVLYEMLSGRRLFSGETVSDILAAVLTRDPEWSALPPTTPPSVVRLLNRCLERDPAARLRHMGDAVLEIAEAQRSGPAATVAAAPASVPARTSRRGWALVAALAAVMAAAGFFSGRSVPRENVLDRAAIIQQNYRDESVFVARFLPDGQSIAYSSARDGLVPEVYILRPEFPDPRPLGLPGAHLLSISSKGELAVLLRPRYVRHRLFTGTLARVPVGMPAPREILGEVREADWSPDGESLAIIREQGGKDRLEYPIGTVLFESDGYLSDPRVSPDGKRVAFFQHPIRWDDRGAVAVVDRERSRTLLSDGYSGEEGIAWSPDGREVLFGASEGSEDNLLYAVTLSGRRRVVMRSPGEVTIHDVARDGRWLVARESRNYGIRGRLSGEKAEREYGWLRSAIPRIAPDGDKLLFLDDAPPWGPFYAVGLRDMRGSAPLRLGEGVPLALSPDGRWALSVVLSSPGQLVLYPTGPGESRRLERGPIQLYSDEVGSWFPDGKQVLIAGSEPGRGSRCYVQSIDGGVPRPVTPEGTRDCRLSPDGTLLLGRAEGGRSLVFPLGGGEPRPVAGVGDGEDVVGWSTDGRAVFTMAGHVVPVRVDRVELASGRRTIVLELSPADLKGVVSIPEVALAHDGAVYAYSYQQTRSELYLVKGFR